MSSLLRTRPDARQSPRHRCEGVFASLRPKGRLLSAMGTVRDFNRHGMSVLLQSPLPENSTIYVTLQTAAHKIDELVAVVHNCTAVTGAYRCGLRFRTQSELQFDQQSVEAELVELESTLMEQAT